MRCWFFERVFLYPSALRILSVADVGTPLYPPPRAPPAAGPLLPLEGVGEGPP